MVINRRQNPQMSDKKTNSKYSYNKELPKVDGEVKVICGFVLLMYRNIYFFLGYEIKKTIFLLFFYERKALKKLVILMVVCQQIIKIHCFLLPFRFGHLDYTTPLSL